jgi:hypothetical protein
MIICDFYFRRRKGEKTYSRLWKLKEFRIFNHFLLDEATTITKMNMAKAIILLPGDVEDIINRINAVRNVVAHSFFPENRRKYMIGKRVLYGGSNIYSADGMRKLEEDFQTVRKYLESKIGFA